MKKSNLRATAALQALALLGAGLPVAFIAAAPAAAQDYTSGAVLGTVNSSTGGPVAGATVRLRSLAQNQVQNFTTDSSGAFSAVGLTPGQYELTVSAPGQQTFTGIIDVTAARSNQVTVDLGAEAAAGGSPTPGGGDIVVTGRVRQANTQGTTGRNVNVVKTNEQLPIGHTIADIALLAPTAIKGVAGFTTAAGESVPSIGGGSVAENAYYINGLNITNPDTYVGSARVPFYFYQNVDVQTGGYPAEFGRATGGVVNATTKSGSNNPFIALHLDWEPDFLADTNPNRGVADNATEIGRYYDRESKQATIEGGGAIVPDHLFIYGLFQINRIRQENAYPTAHVFEVLKEKDPFYGFKVDGYITPTQHAEFTFFDTRSTQRVLDYDFTADDDMNGGTIDEGPPLEAVQESGGKNWVGRYTGAVTDWLTLSAAYGKSRDAGSFLPGDTQAYYVIDRRTSPTNPTGSANAIGQPFVQQFVIDTKRRFYRGDADVRVSLMGQHHFRMGFDQEDLEELKTTGIVGAVPVIYDYRNTGVRVTYQQLGGNISAANTSFYIQDSWTDAIDGLTLNLGLRYDQFKQYNLSGEKYLDLKNNWGPRLGFSYTPPAAEQFRIFGSYGRYFIPPAMNLGFRGRDLFFRGFFDYPAGTDATTFVPDPTTGLPTAPLGGMQSGVPGFGTPCPSVDTTGAPGGIVFAGPNCTVFGAGVQDPALAKLAIGAKATYENEFILGGRYRMNSQWDFGLTGTYRQLKRVSEDTDFGPQLYNHFNCDAPAPEDVDRCTFYSANSAYYIWNPGSESVDVYDWYDALQGVKTPVTLTAADGIDFSRPKRTYKALVFDFNRADDGLWFAYGSVTWAKSRGSNEGTVKSDAGNTAQFDAGSTQDFDYTGLDDFNYGILPNDRKWTFKLTGALHATRNLLFGANVVVQSPMRGSCFSHHPTNPFASGYGASSFFCPTGEVDANGNFTELEPSPRGTGVRGQWFKQIDLSARYTLPLGSTDRRRAVLRADVFNVFNSKAILQRYATATTNANADGTYTPDPLFGTAQAYQQPRYVRLGLDLFWGGEEARVAEPVVEAPPPPPPAAPATQTCPDGSVILATDACPAPPPPPPPPAPEPERG